MIESCPISEPTEVEAVTTEPVVVLEFPDVSIPEVR